MTERIGVDGKSLWAVGAVLSVVLAFGTIGAIFWTGPEDLLSYCPNRDGESGSLGKRVIGEDES